MKSYIIILLVGVMVFVSTGCKDQDNSLCMATVQAEYPDAIVFSLPDIRYRYIVVTKNEVRYVRMMGSWEKITSDNLVAKITGE